MLTVAFELLGLVACVVAIGLLSSARRSDVIGRDGRWVLAAILLLSGFFHTGNVLEWSGVTPAVDPVEDYLWVLMPVLWAFFFYVCSQEVLHSRLQDSEERYRGLVELSPDAIFVHRNGKISYANVAATRFVGLSEPRDLMGRQLQDLLPTIASAAESADSNTSFERSLRRRGEPRDVEVAVCDLHFRGAEAQQVIVRDISARKAVERQLKTGARVLESMIEGVCLADGQGIILYTNPAQDAMFGCARGELLGTKVVDLHVRPREGGTLDDLLEGVATRGSWIGELVNQRKDGTTYSTHARITTLELEGKQCWLCVAQDLSERRRLEGQLFQAQKMESIGRLAGGIAHDFNNLLTVVSGSVDMALAKAPGDAKIRTALQRIREAADRAAELTRQLLGFARKQVYAPSVVNPGEIIHGAEGMLRRLIGEHIELRTRVDPVLWNVKADRSQLTQLLVNLAVNARDAMHEGGGGVVHVEAHNRSFSGSERDNDKRSMPEGEFVLLSVSDTGPGMSEDVRQRVFEPFFTTKEPGVGTGLGLATCYGIVKQNGGFIWANSTLGSGSTFEVYWPRFNGPADVLDGSDSRAGLPRGRERVLVVEDEASVRRIVVEVLEQLGYDVVAARSGAEALERTESFDVLVSDIVMRGMSGTTLAKELRSRRPQLRVLFISGYTSNVDMLEPALRGSVLLQKPFTPQELAQKVREVVEPETVSPEPLRPAQT